MAYRWWAAVGSALLLAAPAAPARAASAPATPEPLLVASLGDGVAAGPGARGCNPVPRSAHALAVRAVERADPATPITFAPFGCAGARIADMERQLVRLDRVPGPADAVLLAVGAADLRLAEAVEACADGRCPAPPLLRLRAGLDALADRLERLDARAVLLTELYDPSCDGAAARQIVAPANRELRDAAARHEWRLVPGVADAFARGCERWLDDGVPNARGHEALGALIAPVLAAALVPPDPAPAPAPDEEDGLRELALTVGGGLAGLMLGVAVAVAVLRRRP